MPMLRAILKVLDDLKDDLPLSERQIHYNLLNDPPLKHASKPGSTYCNDAASANKLSDLCTRGRIEGLIPWDAIDDETRPVVEWNTHRDPSTFIQAELDGFLKDYWRDLLQSQPNHIELVVEKNTVANTLREVAGEFCIPMTSGRGYASLPPRRDIARRFLKSGGTRLILVLVGDFDPDGEEIAHSFARSMRDDFGLDNVFPVKAALTQANIAALRLPSSLEPKKKSKNYPRFVAKYGPKQTAYELEAVSPTVLRELVRNVIENVIDRAAFEHERETEHADAQRIAALRQSVNEAFKEFVN
jgi:hypothetical protein